MRMHISGSGQAGPVTVVDDGGRRRRLVAGDKQCVPRRVVLRQWACLVQEAYNRSNIKHTFLRKQR